MSVDGAAVVSAFGLAVSRARLVGSFVSRAVSMSFPVVLDCLFRPAAVDAI